MMVKSEINMHLSGVHDAVLVKGKKWVIGVLVMMLI
jgi:hypothetical protein